MKKLLFISHHFPPYDYDSCRQLKIAKYLHRYGWETTVLTVRKSQLTSRRPSSLLNGLPPGITLERTFSFENRRVMLGLPELFGTKYYDFWVPDYFIGWLPFALRRGAELMGREKFNAVLSSSQPVTCHLAAFLLKKRAGPPWIADFRDPWTQNPYRTYPVPFSFGIDNWLEKKVVHKADKIVSISDPLTEDLRNKHPGEPVSKFRTITSGFDPEDFAALNDAAPAPHSPWTIIHGGNFYLQRKADTFLEAVKELVAGNEVRKNALRIEFVGQADSVETLRTKLGLEDTVATFPRIPHSELLVRLRDSRAFLLVNGSSELDKKNLPRKLFDYLALRKPILALTPEGEVSKVLRETRAGISVHPEDKEGIKNALGNMLREAEKGDRSFRPDLSVIERYDIRSSAKKFAGLLDEIAG